MQTTIIIFTGLPGTGKTTLSRQVGKTLGITLIAKDDIKEIMYDKIGWSDKAFSAKLAHATFGIMDYITEQHLKTGSPIMLESNYLPKLANKKFQEWQKMYDCSIIQIVFRTDIAVLAHRYADRAQNGQRHPGHTDRGTAQDFQANFLQRIENGEDQPLEVKGPVKIVDTTNFDAVNAEDIASWIKAQVSMLSK